MTTNGTVAVTLANRDIVISMEMPGARSTHDAMFAIEDAFIGTYVVVDDDQTTVTIPNGTSFFTLDAVAVRLAKRSFTVVR